MAVETLQQHLYTYLNHKFGVRALVLDWAGSIMHALAK
jgi:hypothetical protein